jgi:putative DNA methylase
LKEAEESGGWGQRGAPHLGSTVLDRVHQAMILFAAGRGEALRRFVVDEGAGRGERFWRLAQALLALYPTGSDERRWVEGVQARKKGLGFQVCARRAHVSKALVQGGDAARRSS